MPPIGPEERRLPLYSSRIYGTTIGLGPPGGVSLTHARRCSRDSVPDRRDCGPRKVVSCQGKVQETTHLSTELRVHFASSTVLGSLQRPRSPWSRRWTISDRGWVRPKSPTRRLWVCSDMASGGGSQVFRGGH